jgi:hypothetical protein
MCKVVYLLYEVLEKVTISGRCRRRHLHGRGRDLEGKHHGLLTTENLVTVYSAMTYAFSRDDAL